MSTEAHLIAYRAGLEACGLPVEEILGGTWAALPVEPTPAMVEALADGNTDPEALSIARRRWRDLLAVRPRTALQTDTATADLFGADDELNDPIPEL